jgi:DNA repair protein RadB
LKRRAGERPAVTGTDEAGGPLSTGCGAIDELLGGGIERGTVTQVYGAPASGKTNLALSTAVTAAAAGRTVVYIDTEGLSTDRFGQLANAAAGSGLAASEGGAGTRDDGAFAATREAGGLEQSAAVDDGTDDASDDGALATLASRIVVSEAHDFDGQEEAVRDVAEFAERAALVVLDSATGFYRLERDGGDEGAALRRVARQVTHLLSLARRHDLAVLVTNQVFTDPEADRVRPLGGHTLDHWCGVVLRLDRFRGGNRRATLRKHRSKPAGETARFRITGTGLESVEDA